MPPGVAGQEAINAQVKTLYNRLLELSQIADEQVPEEKGKDFSDFNITFAEKRRIRVERVSLSYLNKAPWPVPFLGPEFEIHGRATILDRLSGSLRGYKVPGNYILTVNYPENSQTPQAYLKSISNWLERQQVDISLIKKTQTLLSRNVLKIRDASKVDEDDLREDVRAIRRSFRAYDQTRERISHVLANLDPTTNPEDQAIQEDLAGQIRDRVLGVLENCRWYTLNIYARDTDSALPGTFAQRTEEDIRERRKLFLLQGKGKLVKVPPHPKIIEAVTDPFDPDFKHSVDAELVYWLDTHSIVSGIRDMLPYDIRDLTRKK